MIVTVELKPEEEALAERLTDRCDRCGHLDAMHGYDADCGTSWCDLEECDCASG